MKAAEELAKTILFQGMDEKELTRLAAVAEEKICPAGTALIREGQDVHSLYVIVRGSVKILKKDERGTYEEITTLGSRSYFGEVELVRHQHASAATVETTEQCTLLEIHRDKIEELCSADPTFGANFFRAVAHGLANRLAMTDLTAANYRGMVVKKGGG